MHSKLPAKLVLWLIVLLIGPVFAPSGCFRVSTTLTAPWHSTKPGLWNKDSPDKQALISQKPSLLSFKMTSLQVLLALAAIHDYRVHQMDGITAFLHNVLKEEIYISQLEAFIVPSCESRICRLLKSLYGIKQEPRIWYDIFPLFLLSQGFLKNTSDTNVNFNQSKSAFLFLGLYIDDLILISSALQYLSSHKVLFSQRFTVTNNDEIEYILRIQVQLNRTNRTLTLSQDKYIDDFLTKFNLTSCNQVSTSLEVGTRYSRFKV